MEKLKLHWVIEHKNPIGNILGYATHNKMLRKHCEPLVDFDYNSPLAFHINPADYFTPIQGKKNILLTMWEFDDLPNKAIKQLKYADTVIVPSSYCRDVFRKYTDKKVHVCWEGVEPALFPFKERKPPEGSQKFRILWLGAPNPRKGYQLIQQLIAAVEPFKNIEVYIKTTMCKSSWWYAIKYFGKNWKRICFEDGKFVGFKRAWLKTPTPDLYESCKTYGRNQNVVFDTRKLPIEQLRELYYSAHLFVFPSLGEGWGLPLTEAMATGCPCVAVDHSGCGEFFDDTVGYVIKYDTFKDTLKNYDNLAIDVRVPNTKDFVEKVIYAITHYGEALRKARRASDRVHNKYTWEKSAKRLIEIIRSEYAN
jgi:glycosyltransferase involved in cell wall biosynthesis